MRVNLYAYVLLCLNTFHLYCDVYWTNLIFFKDTVIPCAWYAINFSLCTCAQNDSNAINLYVLLSATPVVNALEWWLHMEIICNAEYSNLCAHKHCWLYDLEFQIAVGPTEDGSDMLLYTQALPYMQFVNVCIFIVNYILDMHCIYT